ncbi:hypothetical protein [Streptomyces sp. NRRL B-1140]|uniref:hypothetical protein n=1 Tax=Streptomyces sp. NRRL B-1140 TaxID=1415549 RepID=UPI0018FED948
MTGTGRKACLEAAFGQPVQQAPEQVGVHAAHRPGVLAGEGVEGAVAQDDGITVGAGLEAVVLQYGDHI